MWASAADGDAQGPSPSPSPSEEEEEHEPSTGAAKEDCIPSSGPAYFNVLFTKAGKKTGHDEGIGRHHVVVFVSIQLQLAGIHQCGVSSVCRCFSVQKGRRVSASQHERTNVAHGRGLPHWQASKGWRPNQTWQLEARGKAKSSFFGAPLLLRMHAMCIVILITRKMQMPFCCRCRCDCRSVNSLKNRSTAFLSCATNLVLHHCMTEQGACNAQHVLNKC